MRSTRGERFDHDCALSTRSPGRRDLELEADPCRDLGRDRRAHRGRVRVRGVGVRRLRQRHHRSGLPHDPAVGGLRRCRSAGRASRATTTGVVRAGEHGRLDRHPAARGDHDLDAGALLLQRLRPFRAVPADRAGAAARAAARAPVHQGAAAQPHDFHSRRLRRDGEPRGHPRRHARAAARLPRVHPIRLTLLALRRRHHDPRRRRHRPAAARERPVRTPPAACPAGAGGLADLRRRSDPAAGSRRRKPRLERLLHRLPHSALRAARRRTPADARVPARADVSAPGGRRSDARRRRATGLRPAGRRTRTFRAAAARDGPAGDPAPARSAGEEPGGGEPQPTSAAGHAARQQPPSPMPWGPAPATESSPAGPQRSGAQEDAGDAETPPAPGYEGYPPPPPLPPRT